MSAADDHLERETGPPPPRSELVKAAAGLQEECERLGRPFCLIGGFVVSRWGEPRVTRDVDAMIYTNFDNEPEVAQALVDRFAPRRPDAVAFASISRVVLLYEPRFRLGIDVALGAFDYDRNAAERSSLGEMAEGVWLRTCSAEDLIVYKAFAGRAIDLNDIKGILIRQRGKLDLSIVDTELAVLAELAEDPEMVTRWQTLRDRHR